MMLALLREKTSRFAAFLATRARAREIWLIGYRPIFASGEG
jgi:hypothetical protein